MFRDITEFLNEKDYTIAVAISRTAHGNHTGILVKQPGKVLFFHLAWHMMFKCEDYKVLLDSNVFLVSKWVYFTSLTADDEIRDIIVPPIIIGLEKVYEKSNGKIPYGLKFRDTKFNSEGDFTLGSGENGLTCATFVVSFLDSMGVQLVDLSSWEQRDTDHDWKVAVISFMNNSGIPLAHIANVAAEELNFRVRPEEVAVSSNFDENNLPATYNQCLTPASFFNRIAI
jgi:hypothetical protein